MFFFDFCSMGSLNSIGLIPTCSNNTFNNVGSNNLIFILQRLASVKLERVRSETVANNDLKDRLREVLKTLTPREEKVLKIIITTLVI